MQAPQLAFALSLPGTIWRVLANQTGTLLVAEIVKEEQRGTHFTAIALSAGKVLWQQWTPAEHELAHAIALRDETS